MRKLFWAMGIYTVIAFTALLVIVVRSSAAPKNYPIELDVPMVRGDQPLNNRVIVYQVCQAPAVGKDPCLNTVEIYLDYEGKSVIPLPRRVPSGIEIHFWIPAGHYVANFYGAGVSKMIGINVGGK